MRDCTGLALDIGDRVGVAFRFHTSADIRTGVIESFNPFCVRWDDGKLSPPMAWRDERIVLLLNRGE